MPKMEGGSIMKREMKAYLQEAFTAPEPVRKEAFLKSTIPVQISTFDFMKTQISYIRKRVWVVSVLIFALGIMSVCYWEKESIWMISSLVPFIALCAVTESARSATYGMSELEMSTRFSLKDVTLARMVSIGVVHFVILGCLIPISGATALLPLIKNGVYLLIPYLLTSMLGLMMVRKIRDRGSIYACMGSAVLVSFLCAYTRDFLAWMYEEKYFIWWCILTVYLLVKVAKEYKKMIYQTEDYAWN